MEDAKKERSSKAGTVTRRVKELENAVKSGVSAVEIKEKISNFKYTFSELGELQDNYNQLIDATDETAMNASYSWYDAYDNKVNKRTSRATHDLHSL